MSIKDSTQLQDSVTTNVIVSLKQPEVSVELSTSGNVNLFIGSMLLSFKPVDAASVAASLATVAATALVNNTLKLVTE